MTDFYALLKQSIIERDIRDAAARETVYAQAREAIIKQLWAFTPPLAADEIDTRVGAYDTAVERIEADLQLAFENGEIPEKPKPGRTERKAEAPPPSPPPPPPPPPEPEPVDYDEMAEEDAPPIAEWNGAYDEDGDDYAEEDDAERGVPRAGRSLDRTTDARLVYDEDAHYADAADNPPATQWSRPSPSDHDDTPRPPRWDWRAWIESVAGSERQRIQILGGAVAGLVLALVILGAYLFLGRGSSDEGVTVEIGVRREVSDAATAARIASETLEVAESYAVFDGRDPTVFASTPENPVRFVSEGGFARVSSSVSSPGVKVLIGPGLATRLAGKNVRVTLVARSSPDLGALNMRFAYQSGLAISHWQTANLAPEYNEIGMLWRVPTMRTGAEGDQLLIEPGIPGDGTAVDIQQVRIDVLAGDS